MSTRSTHHGLGFISLGSRLLIGPIGAAIGVMGVCAATAGAHDCASLGGQWGLLGGGIAVALFDAFALAHEPAASPQHAQLGLGVGPGSLSLTGSW